MRRGNPVYITDLSERRLQEFRRVVTLLQVSSRLIVRTRLLRDCE